MAAIKVSVGNIIDLPLPSASYSRHICRKKEKENPIISQTRFTTFERKDTFMNSTLESSGLSKRKSSKKFSSIGRSWANWTKEKRQHVSCIVIIMVIKEQRGCCVLLDQFVHLLPYLTDVDLPVLIVVISLDGRENKSNLFSIYIFSHMDWQRCYLHETLFQLSQHCVRHHLIKKKRELLFFIAVSYTDSVFVLYCGYRVRYSGIRKDRIFSFQPSRKKKLISSSFAILNKSRGISWDVAAVFYPWHTENIDLSYTAVNDDDFNRHKYVRPSSQIMLKSARLLLPNVHCVHI